MIYPTQFLTILCISCLAAIGSRAQSVTNPEAMSGNPILEGWYADPEGIIFDSLYWIYPTFSAAFADQVYLDAFSSPDLITWKKHPRIIDTTAVSWAKQALWAPSVVKKDDQYYLFFSANDIQTPESQWWKKGESMTYGGIGIGVSDHPGGPFKDYLGKPLIPEVYHGAQPIDPFVFQDGQQYYIFYGGWSHCNVGRLSSDLTSLVPFEDGEMVKKITPKGYVEGPILFKRRGQYYFMWSEGNWTQADYQVAYGTADHPLGPFDRKGVVLQKDEHIAATGAGHHSVINPPGTDEWYIVYHRRPVPNEGRDHRVVCIDRLYFNSDGTIQPVQMTNEGVARRPLE